MMGQKIADLVQYKIHDNSPQEERLMQERERLLVNLNPIDTGIQISPRPMAAGTSFPLPVRDEVQPTSSIN